MGISIDFLKKSQFPLVAGRVPPNTVDKRKFTSKAYSHDVQIPYLGSMNVSIRKGFSCDSVTHFVYSSLLHLLKPIC